MLRRLTRIADYRRGRVSQVPRALVALLVPLAFISPACASSGKSAGGAAREVAKVTELTSVGDLQDRFNGDRGKARLILLISPT